MTTPVFIQAGYAFRAGARLKSTLDANAVGREIAALRDSESVVRVASVVDAASKATSAMHEHFTWDDSEAARKCREDEARYLLRSIVPIYADPRTEDEHTSPVRVFVARYTDTQDDASVGEYQMRTVQTADRPVTAEPAQEDAPQALQRAIYIAPPPVAALTPERERAMQSLRRWADAYGRDDYFAGVVAAIRSLG